MKKVALPVIIGIFIIVGGLYYVMNPVSQVKMETTKQIAQTEGKAPIQKELKDACSIVNALGYEGSCTSKPVTFNNQIASLIKAVNVYGILFEDETFQKIQTNLYFEPKEAVTAYLQKMGVNLSNSDWETVKSEIRMSKRGYLLGLTFTSPKDGVIYISPNGRITGKLN